jgi:hypothetical protein
MLFLLLMDSKIWFYIVVGIIYLVVTILKKKKDPAQGGSEPSGRDPQKPYSEQSKPLTFEELLREITEAKQPPKPVYQAPQGREVVDYDDNIQDEEKNLEVTDENEYQRRSRVYKEYEDARVNAFERPSLEETMKVGNTVMEYKKFKEFEQVKKRNLLAEYTKDLQDREGLRKAFVLSEILTRKF